MAMANLRRMCERYLPGQFEITVVDVLEQPQLAEEAKIMATPTLLKVSPPPQRKVIGDLSNLERVMMGLGLYHDRSPSKGE
jgi:circadian clock protein KaiB